MTDQLNEIVGDDVNIEPDAPETAEPEKVEAPEVAAQEETVEEVRAKTVPLAALHEARAQQRELKQRLEQMQAQQAERDRILQERFDALAKANKPPEPSFEEAPAEHLRSQIAEVRQLAELQQRQQQEALQRQNQERQFAQLTQAVTTVEQQFAAQAPDYYDAVNFLRAQRSAELEALGIDPASAQKQAQQELVTHAYLGAQQGANPAEQAYKIAKARGFRGASISPADKLTSQAKGVAAAKSLGSGGATKNALSLDALAAMSDEDFAEATKGNNWQKLMGG